MKKRKSILEKEWECEWMMDKANVLVKHIEKHIKDMGITSHKGKVICKICDRDIDDIYEEYKKSQKER